jgi:ABC-type transporter Mla MlaB component
MLRVTINKDSAVETWELEGKLSGEWVSELDRLWKQRSPQPGITTEVHLKAVSYIDAAGKQLLAQIRAHGAEIKGCGCMVRAFVEEIMRKKGTADGLPKKILTIILLAGFLLGGTAILCAEHGPPLKLAVQNRVTAGHR